MAGRGQAVPNQREPNDRPDRDGHVQHRRRQHERGALESDNQRGRRRTGLFGFQPDGQVVVPGSQFPNLSRSHGSRRRLSVVTLAGLGSLPDARSPCFMTLSVSPCAIKTVAEARPVTLFATNPDLAPETVYRIHRDRFRIEFHFRRDFLLPYGPVSHMRGDVGWID